MRATESLLLSCLDERRTGKLVRHHIADFGALFAVISALVGCYAGYRGSSIGVSILWAGLSCLLYGLARWHPIFLYWPWRAWMGFAHVLNLIMTTLLMTVVWIVVVVPMGLILKLAGKKIMDLAFQEGASSYWIPRHDTRDEQSRMKLQF